MILITLCADLRTDSPTKVFGDFKGGFFQKAPLCVCLYQPKRLRIADDAIMQMP